MAQKVEPVQRITLGHISAIVFATTEPNGEVWFNLEVTRRCNQGDTNQDPWAFRHEDLPYVAVASIKAYDWMLRQKTPAEPHSEVKRKSKVDQSKTGRLSGRNGPCL